MTGNTTDSAKHVMIVEDDVLIAMDLALMVEETGARVLGPFHTIEAAFDGIAAHRPDLAILDFNLGARTSEPIAARLNESGVPVAFLTGHSAGHVTGRVAAATVIEKPVSQDKLSRLLAGL